MWLNRIFGGFGSVDLPPLPPSPPVHIPGLIPPTLPVEMLPPIPPPLKPVNDSLWFISTIGLRLIMRHEALRLNAYYDPAGIPTIGYGTTVVDGAPVNMKMVFTEADAQRCLRLDANRFVFALQHLITVPLHQNQIDALTDFCYNIGSTAFASSSLRAAINAGKTITADLFTRWNKIHDPITHLLTTLPGLTARRMDEFNLYA